MADTFITFVVFFLDVSVLILPLKLYVDLLWVPLGKVATPILGYANGLESLLLLNFLQPGYRAVAFENPDKLKDGGYRAE